jgi:TolA-binding protein
MNQLMQKIDNLSGKIDSLSGQIQSLSSQLDSMHNSINNSGNSGTATNSGSNTGGNSGSNTGTASIFLSNATVRAGSSVDFNGRGFGIEEPVTVTMNGNQVASAHADGGGNFSTGSISVGHNLGTQTYNFRGMNSGKNTSATITVIP